MSENVDHPQHYGGDTPYEVIKVIEAWDLGFHLGNAIKYIARAGKKDPASEGEDIDKAVWYLQRYLESEFARLKKENSEAPDVKEPKHYLKAKPRPEDAGLPQIFGSQGLCACGTPWPCRYAGGRTDVRR